MRNFPAQYNLNSEDVLYFPHIPKTAGMTFRTIMEDYFHCDDICPATLNAQVAHISQDDLEKYRLFRGHLSYVDIPGLLAKKHLINVTILREPVARVISHYDYIRRTPGDPHHAAVTNMTLEEFAQNLPVGRVGKNVQAYYVAKLAKFELNHLPPDEVLDIAKQSLDGFGFVGLLERFQDSLFLLSYIFGWKPILNSRKENVAGPEKAKAHQQIPDSTIALIKENTLIDQELYDYAQEIFEARFDEMKRNLVSKYTDAGDIEAIAQTMPSNTLRELLEKHYEQRYLELQLPVSSTVSYDFCEPLRGTGWHRREYLNAQSAYRWIGPEPTATLDLPLTSDSDLIVEIQVVCTYATASDIPDSMTLSVNQHPVNLLTLYSDRTAGVRLFQAIIPQSILNKDRAFAQFTFEVSHTIPFTVVNPTNPDPRVVGVAINSLNVFPIHQEKQESRSLALFDVKAWEETARFVDDHFETGEKIAAPLAFKLRLPGEVQNYDQALETSNFSWVVLYKGMIDNLNPILLKLMLNGFAPVFANDSFVIFSTRKDLPKLPYTAPHIRYLYLGRFKAAIKVYMTRQLKAIKGVFVKPSKD